MQEDPRKSASHKLYFGAKMICILSGIEVFVFFLLFVLIAGLSCFSWFHGQTTLNHMFDGIPEGGPVGYLLNIWAFLAIEWEIPAILILRKSFLLFRNYGAIGPDETKRIGLSWEYWLGGILTKSVFFFWPRTASFPSGLLVPLPRDGEPPVWPVMSFQSPRPGCQMTTRNRTCLTFRMQIPK